MANNTTLTISSFLNKAKERANQSTTGKEVKLTTLVRDGIKSTIKGGIKVIKEVNNLPQHAVDAYTIGKGITLLAMDEVKSIAKEAQEEVNTQK